LESITLKWWVFKQIRRVIPDVAADGEFGEWREWLDGRYRASETHEPGLVDRLL
jgi:hypothetical protein